MTRDELKVWLDRKPPVAEGMCDFLNCEEGCRRRWHDWFDDNAEYLGERSARTGPDPIQTDQKCTCEQCRGNHAQ